MPESHPAQPMNKWQRLLLPHSRLERLTLFLLLAGLSIASIQLLLFAQTGVPQTLLAAGGVALAVVMTAIAYVLARRQRRDAAGMWLIAAVFLAYASGELAFSGTTGFFVIGGLLVIALVSLTAFPRRWRVWLIASGLYLLLILLINLLEPLPRHNARDLATLMIQIPAATVLVAIFVLWQVVRAVRGISTIRTRLLVAFVGVALVPALIVIAGLFVGGHTSGKHRVQAQLESVATLKEAEVQTWLDDLQSDLILSLTGDEVSRRLIVLLQERDPSLYPIGYSVLQTRFRQVIQEPGRFEDLFLMDLEGQVVVSTDKTMEGQNHSQELHFQQGLKEPNVQPPFYDVTIGETVIVASRPVYNTQGEVIGVLAGRANLDTLDAIMGERAGLGETGETYLVDSDYTLLTANRFGEKNIKVDTEGAREAIGYQRSGVGMYDNYRDVPVVGSYHWLPTLQAALLAEQTQAEAFRGVYTMLGIVTGVGLLAVLLAVGVSLVVAQGIAEPLTDLAETATEIARGDLTRTAPVQGEDEIATLARAFNSMTAQLRGMIGQLEERVAERTQELERRSRYLEATTEVMRTAATVLELDPLMQQ
ncbi:MAG TPA: sensor histidine kinase, partial [Anaerolineae bacterium]|nr:sensor histidine kinase [Anaerolineae bacterium]